MQVAKKAGFTLIEMVIVMGIIAGLMAFLVPVVMRKWKDSDIQKYKLQLANVKDALIAYKVATGSFPSEQEGLAILANQEKYRKISSGMDAPLKEEDILDKPNRNPIIYHLGKSIKNKDKYRVYELLWIGDGDEDSPQITDGQ